MKNNVATGVCLYKGEEKQFDFFTNLSMMDKLKFVRTVTETLVGDNYYSILREMIFDFTMIDLFTNIDVSEVRDSSNAINLIEEFLQETNAMDVIRANAGELIDELNEAVDENLAFRTGIHKNPIADGLGALIKTLEKKIAEVDTKSLMEMAQVISGMNGELTAEKVLDAYTNSDLFKERHGENAQNTSDNKVINKNTRSRKKADANK